MIMEIPILDPSSTSDIVKNTATPVAADKINSTFAGSIGDIPFHCPSVCRLSLLA